MNNHIYVSSYSTRGLHFGSESGYERFGGSYFEQLEYNENNIINKAIINKVKYDPDSTYCHTDGYGGTCWCAEIIDSDEQGIIYYHFRNFEDLVGIYNGKGYKFVEK